MGKTGFEGRIVAVPEGRQHLTMVQLLENRGAKVISIPLVSILDAPDPEPVLAWLRRFITDPPALFILLTGEGLRRLLALAETHELKDKFVEVLRGVTTLCRGPKPEQVLGTLDLQATLKASVPTTEGVITTLDTIVLQDKRVCLQLYGEDPNLRLQDFLAGKGAATDLVAPYVYASREDEEKVAAFIELMHAGKVDLVAFTSQPQLKRLQEVAKARQMIPLLQEGLQKVTIAAVGPVVKEQLESAGFIVAIMPERVYFMKPMVAAIVRYFDELPATP
ncbi:MAG: uroporphyrinogen-III synthase [Pseudomonadota bacterium]